MVANTELSAAPRANTITGAELMPGIQGNTFVQIWPIDLAVFMTDILLSNSEFSGLINQIYDDLAANTGAELVGTAGGISVQSALELKMDISRLNANTGATLVRTANGVTVQQYLDAINAIAGNTTLANTALATANLAYAQANNALALAGSAQTTADAAYGQANAAIINANNAQATANLAYARANSAYLFANTAQNTANLAFTTIGVAKDSTHLGAFSGGVIPDNNTVKQALQALESSLESGLAGKQPLDPELSALAAAGSGADKLPYYNGGASAAITDFTSLGRSIVAQSAGSGVASLIGAVTGSFNGSVSAGWIDIVLGGTTFKFQWKDATFNPNAYTYVSYPTPFSSWARPWVGGATPIGADAQQNPPGANTGAGNTSVAAVYSPIDQSMIGTVFAIGV